MILDAIDGDELFDPDIRGLGPRMAGSVSFPTRVITSTACWHTPARRPEEVDVAIEYCSKRDVHQRPVPDAVQRWDRVQDVRSHHRAEAVNPTCVDDARSLEARRADVEVYVAGEAGQRVRLQPVHPPGLIDPVSRQQIRPRPLASAVKSGTHLRPFRLPR